MRLKLCPVCGLMQTPETLRCSQCGLEFFILIDAPDESGTPLQADRADACEALPSQDDQADPVPDLECESGENVKKLAAILAAGLAARPWYDGQDEQA